MRIISWNINGLRSCIAQGFREYITTCQADILCLQETKISRSEILRLLEESRSIYPYMEVHCGQKKGYSGTMMLSKQKIKSCSMALPILSSDQEGRIQVVECAGIYILTSADLKENMLGAEILSQVQGSDHCPVLIELRV